MAEDLYDIVFKGELARGVALDDAKKNVGLLFKVSGAKLDALFSGRTVVLKKGVNFEAANKYRVAIKKAGARVDLVKKTPPASQPAEEQAAANVAPRPQGKAVFGERSSSLNETTEVSSSSESAPQSPPSAAISKSDEAQEEDSSGFTLAPVGADMLNPSERKEEQANEIDVSQLSVRAMDGELLDENEKEHHEELTIDLGQFDLAEAGEDLLKDDEKKKFEEKELDLSSLSIAEPGARLGEPAPPPPPAPDVSNIHLENE